MEASSSHSGPLPPAREFAGYESVLPGAAERILRMAEREQDRRIEADRAADDRDHTLVQAQAKLALRAQLITAVVVLGFVAIVAIAVVKGQQLAGVAATLAALATIIYAINGFRRHRGAHDAEAPPPDPDHGTA